MIYMGAGSPTYAIRQLEDSLVWSGINVMHGRGSIKGTQKEDVIVFKVRFNVEYPNGAAPGSFNEGEYTGWHIILVREYPGAPWLIDDQGY